MKGYCYQGIRHSDASTTVWRLDHAGGHFLDISVSLQIHNHFVKSRPIFEWGFWSDGTLQLAMAILLDMTGDENIAREYAEDFARVFLVPEIPSRLVVNWSEAAGWIENTCRAKVVAVKPSAL